MASTGNRLAMLSTASHPDPRLYRLSVAEALARHLPFVVAFATPRFCTSRTCGPVVDVVDAVARTLNELSASHHWHSIKAGNGQQEPTLSDDRDSCPTKSD